MDPSVSGGRTPSSEEEPAQRKMQSLNIENSDAEMKSNCKMSDKVENVLHDAMVFDSSKTYFFPLAQCN